MSVAQIHQRWAIASDLPAIMAIESCCFADPWTRNDWAICLRQRNAVAVIAEIDNEAVGFAVYELESDGVHLLKLAVHPRRQREGIGRAMLARLQDKLSADRRKRVYLEIHEVNLDGQVFLRRCGFRALRVLHGFFEDEAGEPANAYEMQYQFSKTRKDRI